MVWLLERNDDLLTCEIRQTPEAGGYEFELASARGRGETIRFGTPTDLINGYLRWQSALRAQGWRPRIVDEDVA